MSSEQWYFDLNRKVAVPAAERGPGDNMLGPYPSRADAENWKAKVDQRNEAWDDDDDDDDTNAKEGNREGNKEGNRDHGAPGE